MAKVYIKCSISTDSSKVDDATKRKILDRVKALQDEGTPLNDIKITIKKEMQKDILNSVQKDLTKINNNINTFNERFEKNINDRNVAFFGLKGFTKEEAATRSILEMIEGSVHYGQSLGDKINAGNSIYSMMDAEIKSKLTDTEYQLLYDNGMTGSASKNKQALLDNVAREIHNNIDGKTNDKPAQKIAKLYLDMDKKLIKERLLDQGIAQDKIKNYEPYKQGHNREILKNVGKEKWIESVLKYDINTEKSFGIKKMEKAELVEKLGELHNQIINPNQYMQSNIADINKNMFGEFVDIEKNYQLFFNNIEHKLEYNREYNDNKSILQDFHNSFRHYHKLNVINEMFGSKPQKSLSVIVNQVNKNNNLNIGLQYKNGMLVANNQNGHKILDSLNLVLDSYNLEKNTITKIGSISKNLNFATKLGKLAISSITDISNQAGLKNYVLGDKGTIFSSTLNHFSGYAKMILSPEERQSVKFDLISQGASIQELLNETTHTFMQAGKNKDGLGKFDDLTKKVAIFSNQMSGMYHLEKVNQNQALGIQSGIAHEMKSGTLFSEKGNKNVESYLKQVGINKIDVDILIKHGIATSEYSGNDFFSPYLIDKIPNSEIKSFMPNLDEAQIIQYKTDLAEKSQILINRLKDSSMNYISAKTKRQKMMQMKQDTAGAVAVNTFLTFKSYGWEFLNNHIERMINGDFSSRSNQIMYMTEFVANAMALAYVSLAIKDVLANKTPRKITNDDGEINWSVVGDIASHSGLTAIQGDFLLANFTSSNRFTSGDSLDRILGPVYSDVWNVGKSAVLSGKYLYENNQKKADKEMQNTVKHLFKTMPMNNNVVLDTILAVGFSNNKKTKQMKEQRQDYIF